jgi:ribose-phosphate pyrophosphokinase
MDDLVVFSGRSNHELTEHICKRLNIEPGKINNTNFSDGENFVQIKENVRGRDVFFVQSTCPPVNDNLMELLIMIDAARRSSAERITAVIPYFGYARQDRKDRPRVPITAKLVADMITSAGANRVLTVDMHTGQLQGFFNIPVDHLIAAPVLLERIRTFNFSHELVVVSPDPGSTERTSIFANHLGTPLGIIDKRRDRTVNNYSKSLHIIGDVYGKDILLIDDMIDTGGTIRGAATILKEKGAQDIFVAATHGIFSGEGFHLFHESNPLIKAAIITDTIHTNLFFLCIHKVSVGNLLGDAIRFIHNGKSVSSLLHIN